jgi:hypothetical protein
MARVDADTITDLREQIVKLRETRAEHATKLGSLEATVADMRDDVKAILGHIERSKGSWKTLVVIGGITTTFVEGVHQLIGWLHHVPN